MNIRMILEFGAGICLAWGMFLFLAAASNPPILKNDYKPTARQFLQLAESGVLLLCSIALSLLAR